MNIKVAIAVVSNRTVKAETTAALLEMITFTEHEIFPIVATEGYTIAENRTYCVVKAINEGCTHILFIDDDMTFPKDVIEQLFSNDVQIVGVASNSRKLPLQTTVAFLNPEGGLGEPREMPGEPFKCFSVGMGVALIDLNVFKKLDGEWFKFETAANGKIVNGEDGWFCDRARQKGIDIWCDPRVKIGHLGDYLY
jgi:hypothetical protein